MKSVYDMTTFKIQFMRTQLLTTIFVLLSVALPGLAQKRTFADAQKVAADFFQSKDNNAKVCALRVNCKCGRKLLKRAASATQEATDAYYLFANEDNNRLLVVSGDERMQRILGYTDHALVGNAIPDGLADLLEGYAAQYAALGAVPTTSASNAPARSALYKGERQLQTAAWGQWDPFNRMTPQAYPTGCAATAMAIVMRYHQWPDVGNGSKTHIWMDSVMVAKFGETHYDWANMPMSYEKFNDTQATAVALLMRHLGISVEMYYAAESSGARQTLVPQALAQYFRYGSTARLLTASDYDAATWDGMMRKEIDSNRPVIYTGESIQGRGAHGFVLDGYRDNLFHFNFGWNGSGNGYFAISAITSTDRSFEFANKQQAVIGITPLKAENCAPLQLDCQGKYEGFYTTLTTLKAGEKQSVHLSDLSALTTWQGKMQWNLCHADGSVVEALGSKQVQMNGGSTQSLDFEFVAANNAVKGDYLRLVACTDGSAKWLPVLNALGKEVIVEAYERKVPVVEVVSDTKNVTINSSNPDNKTFNGKPLLGSSYIYNVDFNGSVEKSIDMLRLAGGAFEAHTADAVVLTSDTLYIKAKGYTAAELVAQCSVDVEKAGQLETAMQKAVADADAVEALTVTGTLNNTDLQYLSSLQSLQQLNLENATTPQGLFGATFKDFSRLTNCVLPRSLKQIGSETFKNCYVLRSISLPVCLQATGSKLFSGCQALTDIYAHPSSPDCVAADAFEGLNNPGKVTVHVQQGLAGAFQQSSKWSMFARFVDDLPALPQRFTYGGVDYKAIYDGDGNFAEVTFPSGEMYKGAITIPATINYEGLEYTVRGFDNTDGMSPFVGNMFITSLTLELNIERLRAMLFMGCTNLAELRLPETLRHIDSECFRNCPMLKQITLPASIETLGDNAFCGCQYLTDIYCYAMTPPEGSNTDSYPFAQCRPQNVTLHVPASSEAAYRATGFWTKFNNVVADLPDAPVDGITDTADLHTTLPVKAAGKQWVTLHMQQAQQVGIYSLSGMLMRVVQLQKGVNNVWLDDISIIK